MHQRQALKTRYKSALASQASYKVNEFLAFDWDTARLADTYPEADVRTRLAYE